MSFAHNVSPQWMEHLYRLWKQTPERLPPQWRAFFQGFELAEEGAAGLECLSPAYALKQSGVQSLIYRYRDVGHLLSCTNPLDVCQTDHPLLALSDFDLDEADLDTVFHTRRFFKKSTALREIVETLQETYCRSIGVEFMHIQDPAERQWLIDRMELPRNRPDFSAEEKRRGHRGHSRWMMVACSVAMVAIAVDVVAAGVMDGKMDTERSCMAPASTRRRMTGSCPVRIAGQTTCGVAASMTTSDTLRIGVTESVDQCFATDAVDFIAHVGDVLEFFDHRVDFEERLVPVSTRQPPEERRREPDGVGLSRCARGPVVELDAHRLRPRRHEGARLLRHEHQPRRGMLAGPHRGHVGGPEVRPGAARVGEHHRGARRVGQSVQRGDAGQRRKQAGRIGRGNGQDRGLAGEDRRSRAQADAALEQLDAIGPGRREDPDPRGERPTDPVHAARHREDAGPSAAPQQGQLEGGHPAEQTHQLRRRRELWETPEITPAQMATWRNEAVVSRDVTSAFTAPLAVLPRYPRDAYYGGFATTETPLQFVPGDMPATQTKRNRERQDDAPEDDDREAVADTVLRDQLTDPDQEHGPRCEAGQHRQRRQQLRAG